ncbi:MAG TPA: hypothetical protein VJ455_04390 [Ignavibacteria bacterium]|nr:hypothetical protein [Ignavibacteria bacterium]
MKKILLSIIGGIGKGILKPLPLSGIVTSIKEVKQSKFEMEKVLKLAVYILVGIGLWGLILGKLTLADLLQIIKALGI